MRLIASDTSLLLPGLLSPAGLRRRLLVVFAYGAAGYYDRLGNDEANAVDHLAASLGATIGGLPMTELLERSARRKARFDEHLPPMTPDDLVLVGGAYLFDEVERKLHERGERIARGPVDVTAVVRLLQAICGPIVAPFPLTETPQHTDGKDRHDDPLVEIGLRAGASAMVSDDRRHVSPSADEPTVYHSADSSSALPAYQFAPFVNQMVNTVHFDLDAVDPTLLRIAFE